MEVSFARPKAGTGQNLHTKLEAKNEQQQLGHGKLYTGHPPQ